MKRLVWRTGILATALVAAMVLGCAGGSDGEPAGIVRYLVTSTCTTDIDYRAANNLFLNDQDVASGWEFKFAAEEKDVLFISATLNCDGTVTVDIFKDGRKFKTNTASGLEATATAEGRF